VRHIDRTARYPVAGWAAEPDTGGGVGGGKLPHQESPGAAAGAPSFKDLYET